jgi:hypothetical protein
MGWQRIGPGGKAALMFTLATLAAPVAAQPAAPAALCTAAEHRQMDFWVGDWAVEFDNPDGSIGRASNRIRKDEYGSCVISEYFKQPGGAPGGGDYLGTSYSSYDTQTKSWRQFWVDNMGGIFDLRGGPVAGQKHSFELVTIEPRGAKRETMRMIWEDVTAAGFVWRWQARGADGKWADKWVLRYKRKA